MDFEAKTVVLENRIAAYVKVREKRKRKKRLFAGQKTFNCRHALSPEEFSTYLEVKNFVDQVRINQGTRKKLAASGKYEDLSWLSHKVDKQASQLAKDVDKYFPYLQHCGLNYTTVLFMARRQEIRELAHNYANGKDRDACAARLLNLLEIDRPNAHQETLKRERLNLNEIKAWALLAASNQPQEKEGALLVKKYQDASRDVAKFYRENDP